MIRHICDQDVGWVDVFAYYDGDSDCILNDEEVALMCTDMEDICRAFISGAGSECAPVYLNEAVGWADVFAQYDTTSCTFSLSELQAICGDSGECSAFGDFNSRTCEPLYLGDGIGFVDVYVADETGCRIDLGALARTCADYPSQCTTFLESAQCPPVWLGHSSENEGQYRAQNDNGYANVFEWDPDSGVCRLDMAEVAVVCGAEVEDCVQLITVAGCPAGWYDHDNDMTTGCLPCQAGTFSPSRAQECSPCRANWADTDKNPATPCQQCANGFESLAGATSCTNSLHFCPPAANLGPTVGVQEVYVYSDSSCHVDSDALAALCPGTLWDECLAFLQSDQQCDPVFLGNTIGWVSVYTWHAESGTCRINQAELQSVCDTHVAECAAYLTQGSSSALDCEPDFLGPETGWATVRSLGQGESGEMECQVDADLVLSTCAGAAYDSCIQHLTSGTAASDCAPLWLGEDVGFVSVYVLSTSDNECHLSADLLAAACVGFESECHAVLTTGR